jgi:hypothetical protein
VCTLHSVSSGKADILTIDFKQIKFNVLFNNSENFRETRHHNSIISINSTMAIVIVILIVINSHHTIERYSIAKSKEIWQCNNDSLVGWLQLM